MRIATRRSSTIGTLSAVAILFTAFVPGATASSAPSALSIFRPVLKKLHRSPVPAYLPSWLPRSVTKHHLYPFSFTYKNAYEADLSVYKASPCNACTVFFIDGGRKGFPVKKNTPSVPIRAGQKGYLVNTTGTMGIVFQWKIGSASYYMRCPCTDAQYVRVAKGVVRAS